VRVEGKGIGAVESGEVGRCRRVENAHRAVSAVDVEPQAFCRAEVGERVEEVDRAGADRARAGDHAERPPAGVPVRRDRGPQGGDVHPMVGAHRDRADVGPAEPKELRRLADAAVSLLGHVQHQRCRPILQPVLPHVATVDGDRPMARGGQGGERGHRTAADQEASAALGWKADELHQPAHRASFQVGGRMVATGAAGIERGGEELGQHADREGRRVDPAEEAWVAVAHRVGKELVAHDRQEVGRRAALVRQRLGQQARTRLRRHRLVDRPSANSLEVIGRQVDREVAEVAEGLVLVDFRHDRQASGQENARSHPAARAEAGYGARIRGSSNG
jgi:hypothetical protein